ncbi:hypothetical protein HGI30_16755 [Paenibacillus albicereus]|uniref:Uncharacterized protein n=1 Tax=Paenibacillus albicereus TaxID=2726185 RepID=A0A6H2H072_9BACL|nr:hypothetical protein [Paenibacillus albicereus]QJC53060.1 hypothetical protein HGI30_16755 [Paenibacillus albicereus]
MMITLQLLNVVKVVESESKAEALEAKGFKRVELPEKTKGKAGTADKPAE